MSERRAELLLPPCHPIRLHCQPSAILLCLPPYFPAQSSSQDPTETLNALLASECTDSLASASNTVVQFDRSEAVFFTCQDMGYGFRYYCRDLRTSPRPALVLTFAVTIAQHPVKTSDLLLESSLR